MFRCESCKTVTPAGTKLNRLPVELRTVNHPFRVQAQNVRIPGKRKSRPADDPGGTGTQIVREALVCPRCFGAAAASMEEAAK